jgi:hypothetical protein
MAHIKQSRRDPGLVLEVEVLEPFEDLSSLGSGVGNSMMQY